MEKAAKATNQTLSAFILDNAIRAANIELEAVHIYKLGIDDANKFINAIDNLKSIPIVLKEAFRDFGKKYSVTK